MFNFIKSAFAKIYTQVTSRLGALFSRAQFTQETQKELEEILIGSDMGVKTSRQIIENLKKTVAPDAPGSEIKVALRAQLQQILKQHYESQKQGPIYLLVGINGSGKTTTAAKLAHQFKCEGKRVLLVAADTFRAAAVQQLEQWANRLSVAIIKGKEGQDPASVVYAGMQEFKNGGYDAVIIDTAGRLQTKSNLMKELAKLHQVISKQAGQATVTTLLTIDAMLGQNSLEQARLFSESTQVNGITLTKLDGTGKGGIVFAIAQELDIPVAYISFGEQLDQLKRFDAQEYISTLLG